MKWAKILIFILVLNFYASFCFALQIVDPKGEKHLFTVDNKTIKYQNISQNISQESLYNFISNPTCWDLNLYNDNLLLVFVSPESGLYLSESYFDQTGLIEKSLKQITNEVFDQVKIVRDKRENLHLATLKQPQGFSFGQIVYSQTTTWEPKTIYLTNNKLKEFDFSLKATPYSDFENLIVSWQEFDQALMSNSLNYGKSFNPAKAENDFFFRPLLIAPENQASYSIKNFELISQNSQVGHLLKEIYLTNLNTGNQLRLVTLREIISWEASDLAPGDYSLGLSYYNGFKTLTEPEEITFSLYDPASLEVKITSPTEHDWFASGSTLIIEASIESYFAEIKPEDLLGQLDLAGNLLEVNFVHDQENRKLFALASLPENLADGSHRAKLKIGQRSQTDFIIKIDNQPPQLSDYNNQVYTNSLNKVAVAATDFGSGIDTNSSQIDLGNATFEVNCISFESGTILFYSDQLPLTTTNGAISLTLRDLVGNTCQYQDIKVVLDQTAPELIITSSYEAITKQRKLSLAAQVEDQYPDTIKVMNNGQTLRFIQLNSKSYHDEIGLFPGSNHIILIAQDKAGNQTLQTIDIQAEIQASNNQILLSANHGPSPFSPSSQTLYFTYSLASQANILIRVFDLAGNQIWTQARTNASSGNISWDGVDLFGHKLSNGVYPYIIEATANGNKELYKSKIAVFQ